ncbi:hypothetical protein TraAM80_03358 [Trypanosoma rangeli]|uniref:Uncharacterized protein n=1 Tax=Trypanosoma rangeli TaxID=5698 RepID=A0A3S5IRL7_TRYRA|nr:uncharacterized protein TraAM80_03358 [Trypanosoma rangeli]RNF07502.1 hypothetical protein TraAM80_03358 [Trypanosoma rangeli]|eukprot:RNF07502.1 hypothetical protein TraAM80_03358 [Trypanosoma rangeli]
MSLFWEQLVLVFSFLSTSCFLSRRRKAGRLLEGRLPRSMFATAGGGRHKWGGLHPLQFRLACAALRCPYDLPAEGGRRGRAEGSSWLSSLAVSEKHGPCRGTGEGALPSSKNMKPTEPHEETSGNKLVFLVLRGEEEAAARPAAQAPNAGAIQSTGGAAQSEADTSQTASEPHEAGEEHGSHPIQREQECVSRSAEAIGEAIRTGNARAICAPHGEEGTTSTACPRSGALPQHSQPTKTRTFCSVAVGPGGAHGNNNTATIAPGCGSAAETPAPPELCKVEALLSTTLERFCSKLQGAASKAAALDELSQRLAEALPQPRKGVAAGEDRAELAIHLHSLRRQVELLMAIWSEEEAARKALEKRQKRQHEAAVKVVRVEIVRAYEETPVPYKKRVFTPLNFTTRPLQPPTAEAPSSASDSRSTTASSATLSYTQSAEPPSMYSAASGPEYSDDFEDE